MSRREPGNIAHAAGIETGVHYPTPPHRQQAYREMSRQKGWSCPVAEQLARTALSLPVGPHLGAEHAERVAEVLLPLLRE
jgi:dTDP-3-amino-3,4,6-trideoxy-alpha-D-glucose transaminase